MPYFEIAEEIEKAVSIILGRKVLVKIFDDITSSYWSISACTRWPTYQNMKVGCCIQHIEAGEKIDKITENMKAIAPYLTKEIAEKLREPTIKEIGKSWPTISEVANKENIPRHRIYYAIRHHQRFAIKHKGLWRIKPNRIMADNANSNAQITY